MTVRPAASEHAQAMAALADSLKEWFTPDVPAKVRAEAESSPGLVALDDDGALVGFLIWEQKPDEYEIEWIAVARERHRQGIGRLLVSRLVALMRDAGVMRLRVDTVAPNVEYEPYARTRSFYQACCFKLESTEPAGWPDGTDKGTYVMVLL